MIWFEPESCLRLRQGCVTQAKDSPANDDDDDVGDNNDDDDVAVFGGLGLHLHKKVVPVKKKIGSAKLQFIFAWAGPWFENFHEIAGSCGAAIREKKWARHKREIINQASTFFLSFVRESIAIFYRLVANDVFRLLSIRFFFARPNQNFLWVLQGPIIFLIWSILCQPNQPIIIILTIRIPTFSITSKNVPIAFHSLEFFEIKMFSAKGGHSSRLV